MNQGTLLLAALAVAGSSACYRYVPTSIETLSEGDRVRALLRAEALDRLRERHDLDDNVMQGTLVARNGDRLSFHVPGATVTNPLGGPRTFYQVVEVSQADVLRTDLRKVDGFKTASLALVGVAAATVVIVESVTGGGPAPAPPGNGGPPESVRAWLLRIPVVRW